MTPPPMTASDPESGGIFRSLRRHDPDQV